MRIFPDLAAYHQELCMTRVTCSQAPLPRCRRFCPPHRTWRTRRSARLWSSGWSSCHRKRSGRQKVSRNLNLRFFKVLMRKGLNLIQLEWLMWMKHSSALLQLECLMLAFAHREVCWNKHESRTVSMSWMKRCVTACSEKHGKWWEIGDAGCSENARISRVSACR